MNKSMYAYSINIRLRTVAVVVLFFNKNGQKTANK